jgi:SAM-dependent methyltransferase
MDPYESIAEFYDLEHEEFDEDLQLYRQMLREGPILEVGIGTGRIGIALAHLGLEIWGIDTSTQMLARARERARGMSNLHLVEADIRELDLEQRFRAALFPLNTLWHLPDSNAQLLALSAIRRHLESGCLLIVDTSNPLMLADRGANGEVRVRSHPKRDADAPIIFSAAWDDEAEQTLTLELWSVRTSPGGTTRRQQGRLSLRYLYRPELELVLRLAGFSVERVYGSYELEPYTTSSPRIIVTARPA